MPPEGCELEISPGIGFMILNTFAVLDGFVTLARVVLAVLIVVLAVRAWRRRGAESREHLENRGYLLYLVTFLLLFLNLASWPIFYLLLESYVPEWPGVMCIYGVTRVGTGSLGPSRYLPGLLQGLQVLKPAVVFSSGAWGTLYLANRKTPNSPLLSRILLVVIGLGLLAIVDCALEAAYLTIPKQEILLESGCCAGQFDDDARFLPLGLFGEVARPWLAPAFFGVNVCMILALFLSVKELTACEAGFLTRQSGRKFLRCLGLLLVGAIFSLLVSGAFLVDVAAPTWLRLPHHHCPYDLIPRAPEAVLGVASFLGGTFAVGWANVAGWFANCPETQATLPEQIRKILALGLFGYAGALVMVAMEFALS
jgi:hypothetical protein